MVFNKLGVGTMNLSPEQKKVVVSALELYRLATLQPLRSTNSDENVAVKAYHESVLEQLNDVLDLVKYDSANQSSKVQKPVLALKEVRVLIAEDNKELSGLLVATLRDMGIDHIDTAENGQKSLEAIQNAEQGYHLILSDWNMPKLSGLQVHAKVTESNSLKGALYILISGVSDDVLISKANRQGLDDFIAKPIDPDAIQEKVLSVLNIKS